MALDTAPFKFVPRPPAAPGGGRGARNTRGFVLPADGRDSAVVGEAGPSETAKSFLRSETDAKLQRLAVPRLRRLDDGPRVGDRRRRAGRHRPRPLHALPRRPARPAPALSARQVDLD